MFWVSGVSGVMALASELCRCHLTVSRRRGVSCVLYTRQL